MPVGVDVLHLTLAAAIGIWTIHARSDLRSRGPERSLWVGMLALGVGEAIHAGPVYHRLDAATGPGWAQVIYHSVGLIAAIAVLDLLHGLLAHTRGARRATAVAGLVAIALAAAPWVIDAPTATPPALRAGVVFYDPTWVSAVHWAAFLAYLAWALASATVQCLRNAGERPSRRLSAGMRLVGVGCASGLGYVTAHAVVEIAWLTGRGAHLADLDQILDALTLGPAVALIVLGAGWSSIFEQVDQLTHHRTRRDLQRRVDDLRPVWALLNQHLPEISAFPHELHQRSADEAGLRWQQQRMTVEIYDARRRLAVHISAHEHAALTATAATHGLRGNDVTAVVEHICLLRSLRRHAAGPPAHSAGLPARLPAPTAASAAALVADLARRARQPHVRAVIDAITTHDLQKAA